MKCEQEREAARRMGLQYEKRKGQSLWFTHSVLYLQMAFSERSADEEDGNGTGLIIRDITDTLENATNGLLAVAHTSGRARYVQSIWSIYAWVNWVVTLMLVIHMDSGKQCLSECPSVHDRPVVRCPSTAGSIGHCQSSCLFRSPWRPVRLMDISGLICWGFSVCSTNKHILDFLTEQGPECIYRFLIIQKVYRLLTNKSRCIVLSPVSILLSLSIS